jgi:hypothetical protein
MSTGGKSTSTRAFLVVLGLSAVPAWGVEVWRSTFDTGADGVVDTRDDNPNKVMIGPAGGGTISITTMGYADTLSDKAGRPLGSTVTAADSFGAYYKWHYTGYETDGTSGVEEIAGFHTSTSPHSTRRFMGAAFNHFKSGAGDHMVRFGMRWASEGFTGSGRCFLANRSGNNGCDATVTGPTDINLGPNLPTGIELQVAIGYDGPSQTLKTAIYDGAGMLLKEISANIRFFDNLAVAPDSPALDNEVNNLALTHLGWTDFISGSNPRTHTWGADTLAYFNDAEGAFAAVIPEPATAVLLMGGLAGLTRRNRSRS